MKDMIEIPIGKVPDVIEFVYDNSIAVGMGWLHFQGGKIPKEVLDDCCQRFSKAHSANKDSYWEGFAHTFTMDYILGRCCKMHFFRDEAGKVYIRDRWMDHDFHQLQALLDHIGVQVTVPDHGEVKLMG